MKNKRYYDIPENKKADRDGAFVPLLFASLLFLAFLVDVMTK